MTAILKVDTIQDTSGNNIINENANTITIGKSGDTVNLAAGAATGTGMGKVLQVVTDVFSTETSTTSTSYVAVSGFAATITPSSTSSKILVLCSASSTSSKILVLCSASSYINTSDAYLGTIYRGGTDLGTFGRLFSTAGGLGGFISFNYLDSPSTTSATTYTYYHKVGSGTGYVSVNNYKSNLTLLEIAG
jgi:hypothetical protein